MNADAVVFLGPSLPRAEAARILPRAEFLPPVRRDDIDALLARAVPPAVIGIVDGSFMQQMSISPKEVLRAVDRGVTVLGSSSMGALRAAELDTMGMTGIGRVYEMYASGEIDADDEVAVTFDADTLAPLCVPMVNFRVATRELVARGRITAEAGRRVLDTAKAMYFPDRTVANVTTVLAAELGPEAAADLRDAYTHDAPDAKGDDARALLRHVAALARPDERPAGEVVPV